jgi:hypothetical protein
MTLSAVGVFILAEVAEVASAVNGVNTMVATKAALQTALKVISLLLKII